MQTEPTLLQPVDWQKSISASDKRTPTNVKNFQVLSGTLLPATLRYASSFKHRALGGPHIEYKGSVMEPYDDRDPQHVQSALDPKGLRRDLSLQTKGPIISSSGVPGGLALATSSQMQFRGDHLHISENYGVLKMLNKQGDNEVHFADKIMKINRGNEMRKRLLVITGSNFYILDPASFRCKRQIPLETINALCLSELNDNFFAIIVASGNDMLLASSRKTEIVTVLHTALKSLRLDLNVEFTNSFTFTFDSETAREVQLHQINGGVSARITDVNLMEIGEEA